MQKINASSNPQPGKGYVYSITVKRKGLPDMVYIGATRRSINTRFNEHLEMAKTLGELEIPGKSTRYQSRLGYDLRNESSNPIHAIIRTSIGITKTNMQKAREYVKIEPVGEYSLIGLPAAETQFIGGKNVEINSLPSLKNYETLRYSQIGNVGPGGEGLGFRDGDTKLKILGAFYFLRDEANVDFKTDLEVLRAIAFYAYPRKTVRSANDPILERIRLFLISYFGLKQKILAVTDDSVVFDTIAKTRAFINNLFVEKTKVADKITTSEMITRLNINHITVLQLFKSSQSSSISRTGDIITDAVSKIANSGIPKVIQRELDIVINKIDFNIKKNKK